MSVKDHMDSLFAEYEKQRNSVAAVQEQMRTVSASAMSSRREVFVTVGQNGMLTEISFPSGASRRLPPIELAALILRTYEDAKEQVLDKSAELLAPLMPAGLDPAAMVRGKTGVDALLPPDGPPMADAVREALGLADAPGRSISPNLGASLGLGQEPA